MKGSEEAPSPPWVPHPAWVARTSCSRKPPRATRESLWVAGAWAKISSTRFQREEHSLGLVTAGPEDSVMVKSMGLGTRPAMGHPLPFPSMQLWGRGLLSDLSPPIYKMSVIIELTSLGPHAKCSPPFPAPRNTEDMESTPTPPFPQQTVAPSLRKQEWPGM